MTDWEYFRSSSTTKHGHRTLSQKGWDIPFWGIRGATIEPQDALRFDRLLLLAKDTRWQQILKADAPKQFRANPIGYAVDDLSAILRRVDVGPKRPLAEGHVDDVDDRFRNFAGIGVSGLQ